MNDRDRETVCAACDNLPRNHQKIVAALSTQLETGQTLDVAEIAREAGLSKPETYSVHSAALLSLRRELRDDSVIMHTVHRWLAAILLIRPVLAHSNSSRSSNHSGSRNVVRWSNHDVPRGNACGRSTAASRTRTKRESRDIVSINRLSPARPGFVVTMMLLLAVPSLFSFCLP